MFLAISFGIYFNMQTMTRSPNITPFASPPLSLIHYIPTERVDTRQSQLYSNIFLSVHISVHPNSTADRCQFPQDPGIPRDRMAFAMIK